MSTSNYLVILWTTFIFFPCYNGMPPPGIRIVDINGTVHNLVNGTSERWSGSTGYFSLDCYDYQNPYYTSHSVIEQKGTIYSHSERERVPGSYYPSAIRCALTVIGDSGKRFQLFTRETVQLWYGDNLYIYDGTLTSSPNLAHFSSYTSNRLNVETTGSMFSIYFKTNSFLESTGFTIYYSEFRNAGYGGCHGDEIGCQGNSRCVDASFRCDGHFACPDETDEMNCFDMSPGIIAAIVIFVLLVITIVTVAISCYLWKKKHRTVAVVSVYPNAGYPTQPNPGYPTQPNPGYPTQPNPGYPTQPNPGYPTQPNPGYPTQPNHGYLTQPMADPAFELQPRQAIISPAVSPLPPIQPQPLPSYTATDLHPSQIPAPANYINPS